MSASFKRHTHLIPLLCLLWGITGCDVKGLISQLESGNSGPASEEEREAAYAERIGATREQRLDSARERFFERQGADKSVEVVVTGVVGDPAAAKVYLSKKLFKAAFHDYTAASKQAKEQTAANKKAAADAAVAEQRELWGDEGFGPSFVHFKYKPVESKLDYPRIETGPTGEGTYTFYASPVLDMNAFAERFGVGETTNVDSSTRTVTIRAMLPTPIPDFDVEEMLITHGAENVVTLTVSGAGGDPEAVRAYLRLKTSQLDPTINLFVAGPKASGRDTYEMTVAPVGDLRTFANRIQFGKVATVDEAGRGVTVLAELPDPLPTAALANRSGGAAGSARSSDWSDFDKNPQPGESEIDWALRILKGGGLYVERALTELASMEPDPKELQRVSETLAATFNGNGLYVDRHLDAMVNWKTPELARKITDKMTEDWTGQTTTQYVAAISRMELPEANDMAAESLKRKIIDDNLGFKFTTYLNALETLERPEVAVEALKVRIQREAANFGDEKAIQALTRFKTPEACEILASQLGNRWVGEDAAIALRQMGMAAESVALRMLKHPAPAIRAEGATLLYEMASPAGADAIGKAIGREKVAVVKNRLRQVRKALIDKTETTTVAGDDAATNDSESPFVLKEP